MSGESRLAARGRVALVVADFRKRHRYLPNALLHAVGIPLTLAGIYLAWRGYWLWTIAAVVGGYALQVLGHVLQGTEVGELALIARLLGSRRSRQPL